MTILAGLILAGYILVWLVALIEGDDPVETLVVGGLLFMLVGIVAVCTAAIK